MSTNNIDVRGESDIFGLPTEVGPWVMTDERSVEIVWRRDLEETDLDPQDGQEKSLFEYVVVRKGPHGGSFRGILKKGFADTPLADTPQLTRFAQASATDEGREMVIEEAIDFMTDRVTEQIQETVGGLLDEEEQLIEEVLAEEDADRINGWRRVQPEHMLPRPGYDTVLEWQNDDETVYVILGFEERETDDGERDPQFRARMFPMENVGGISKRTIHTFGNDLETALDDVITFLRTHNPNTERATFEATIEGGIIIPLVNALRRYSSQALIEARADSLYIQARGPISTIDFRIGRDAMHAYDVQRQGQIVVKPSDWWDQIGGLNFSQNITMAAEEDEDGGLWLRLPSDRISANDPVAFLHTGVPDPEPFDARFATPGLNYRDVTLAARSGPDDTGAIGVVNNVPILVIQGPPEFRGEGTGQFVDDDLEERFAARFDATSVEGAGVVALDMDQLHNLRRVVPRPSQTDIQFTILEDVPLLVEYMVDGIDVDLRIALKSAETIEDFDLSIPVAEITVPEEDIDEDAEQRAEQAVRELIEEESGQFPDVEAALEQAAPGVEATVTETDQGFQVTFTPDETGVQFDPDEPFGRAHEDLDFAVERILEMWELRVDLRTIPVDEIEGIRRNVRRDFDLDIAIPRFPQGSLDTEGPIMIQAPVEGRGAKRLDVSSVPSVPDDSVQDALEAVIESVGESTVDQLIEATRRGGANRIGTAFFEADAFQRIELDRPMVEAILQHATDTAPRPGELGQVNLISTEIEIRRVRGEIQYAGEFAGFSDEQQQFIADEVAGQIGPATGYRTEQTVGRVIHTNVAPTDETDIVEITTVDPGRLEEADRDEPTVGVIELPVTIEEATTGLVYAPPAESVSFDVADQIDDAFQEALGPAGQFTEGRRVGTAFVTDVDITTQRDLRRIEVSDRLEREREEPTPPEPEPEPDEETISIIVSIIGGSTTYNLPGRIPGAVEDEAISAAEDTLGPANQFNVNTTVGEVTFRESDIVSIDLSQGRELLPAQPADFPDSVGAFELREDSDETLYWATDDGTGVIAEHRDGVWVIWVRDDLDTRSLLGFARSKQEAADFALDQLEEFPRVSDARNAARSETELTDSDIRRATDNQIKGQPAQILAKHFESVEAIGTTERDFLDALEGIGPSTLDAIDEFLRPRDEQLPRHGNVFVVGRGDDRDYFLGASDDEPYAPSIKDSAEAALGSPTQFEPDTEVGSFTVRGGEVVDLDFEAGFDILEAAEREVGQEIDGFDVPQAGDLIVGRRTLDVPQPPDGWASVHFININQPNDDDEGDRVVYVSPDRTLTLRLDGTRVSNKWSMRVLLHAEPLPDDATDDQLLFGPEGSDSESLFRRLTHGNVVGAEAQRILANNFPSVDEARNLFDPDDDFGRTVEGTFTEEVIEAGDVEEEVVEDEPPEPAPEPPTEDGDDTIELPVSVDEDFADGLLYSVPANTVSLDTAGAIGDEFEGAIGPAEQFDLGTEVGSAFVTDDPDPRTRELVRIEPIEIDRPDEREVVDLSQGQVETIVENATIGVRADVQFIGSTIGDIVLNLQPNAGVQFTIDAESVTVTARQTTAETVIAAIERWDSIVDQDSISTEERTELNEARDALQNQFGIDIPQSTVPVPPPEGGLSPEEPTADGLHEEEIETIILEATVGASVDVTINPAADSIRIDMEPAGRSDVAYRASLEEIQGQASRPIAAIEEALDEWEDAIDPGTLDVDPINRSRGRIGQEFNISLPQVRSAVEAEAERQARLDIKEQWEMMMDDLEFVPIDERSLAGQPEGPVPIEVDEEFAQFADDEDKRQIERGMMVHHTEDIHDDVHAFVAQLLGAEPENFYDSSKPSDLPGYDLFYEFTLTRNQAPGEWTNPRFAPSTLLEILSPLDNERLKVVVRGSPLA